MQRLGQWLLMVSAGALLAASGMGCSSSADLPSWGSGGDDGGAGTGPDGSPSTGGDGAPASGQDAGGALPDATSVDSGNAGTGDGGSGAQDAASGVDAAPDAGSVTSNDGFAASRTACINKINALRATDTAIKLQPYTLQNDDTTNSCVDQQATNDQSQNTAHYSFNNKSPWCSWGNANQWGQNECLQGYGTSPAGIEQCLQDMWNESLQPNCAGCIGCSQPPPNGCANCDFYGTMGSECGHYVNMSAPYFTSVACGFAGASPSTAGGWSVQNFE